MEWCQRDVHEHIRADLHGSGCDSRAIIPTKIKQQCVVWGVGIGFVWMGRFPTTLAWNLILHSSFNQLHLIFSRQFSACDKGGTSAIETIDHIWQYLKHFWMCLAFVAFCHGLPLKWSSPQTDRQTDSLLSVDVWLLSNKSECRLAFDLQQAGLSRRPPAKKCAENWAGDQWAPLAGHHAGQRGEADGPSGDSLARDRGCSVPVRVCVRVASTDWGGVVLGDHLSCLSFMCGQRHRTSRAPVRSNVPNSLFTQCYLYIRWASLWSYYPSLHTFNAHIVTVL